jgi:hypothetical protein
MVLAAGTCAGRASAQDFGVGPQREPSLVTSRLGLESSVASFDQQGVQGDFAGLTARGDLKVSHTVRLRLLVPMYAIQLAGEQPRNYGFGDAALQVRVLLYEGHPWRFYYGLEDQLPTGDTAIGTGQGGTQLSPFITGGWRTGSFVAYFNLADCIGLHPQWGPGKPAPVDYVDPSTDEELRTAIGGYGEITEALYFSAAVTAVNPLLSQDSAAWTVIGGAALGYVFDEDFKIVVVEQAPLAGQHRFDEKIGLDAYVYF